MARISITISFVTWFTSYCSLFLKLGPHHDLTEYFRPDGYFRPQAISILYHSIENWVYLRVRVSFSFFVHSVRGQSITLTSSCCLNSKKIELQIFLNYLLKYGVGQIDFFFQIFFNDQNVANKASEIRWMKY